MRVRPTTRNQGVESKTNTRHDKTDATHRLQKLLGNRRCDPPRTFCYTQKDPYQLLSCRIVRLESDGYAPPPLPSLPPLLFQQCLKLGSASTKWLNVHTNASSHGILREISLEVGVGVRVI